MVCEFGFFFSTRFSVLFIIVVGNYFTIFFFFFFCIVIIKKKTRDYIIYSWPPPFQVNGTEMEIIICRHLHDESTHYTRDYIYTYKYTHTLRAVFFFMFYFVTGGIWSFSRKAHIVSTKRNTTTLKSDPNYFDQEKCYNFRFYLVHGLIKIDSVNV